MVDIKSLQILNKANIFTEQIYINYKLFKKHLSGNF